MAFTFHFKQLDAGQQALLVEFFRHPGMMAVLEAEKSAAEGQLLNLPIEGTNQDMAIAFKDAKMAINFWRDLVVSIENLDVLTIPE